MVDTFSQVIHSHLWQEQAEPDNPFVAATCRCYGYDVYGDLLGKANYIEYLYLLFRGERPTQQAASTLELLALALANPGPRDPAIHAAMASGVGGSPACASLMAALAVGAGASGGAREVLLTMQNWNACGTDLEKWQECLSSKPAMTPPIIWPTIEHAPGFDPHGVRCATPVQQTLAHLCRAFPQGNLAWLARNQHPLESAAKIPLALSGVVAAALIDLGFSPSQGEMLTLFLRLPGAAVHALEQSQRSFRQFPFFPLELENDPGPAQASVQESA